MMMTELDGRLPGLNENAMVIHLVIPFGRIASPSYFQLFGTDAKALRESYGMGDIGWSGSGHFSSFIYVGDAIWVENAFGSRLTGSVESLEWACKRIPNNGTANDIKTRIEGGRIAKVLIL